MGPTEVTTCNNVVQSVIKSDNARLAFMKAVIPAAQLGTRLLTYTKAQSKEMLPFVDKPVIRYVLEETVGAGPTFRSTKRPHPTVASVWRAVRGPAGWLG